MSNKELTSIPGSITIVQGEPSEEVFEAMNKAAKEYYESVWHQVMDDCTDENERQIVTDWWNRKYIYNKEYEEKYDKDVLRNAHSRILEIISLGCG